MDLNEYQRRANLTAKVLEPKMDMIHAALGLTSDAGEYATLVKAHVIYGKELNIVGADGVLKELGDVLWFLARAASAHGLTLEEIALANNEKLLRQHYPNGYSDEAAIARADRVADAKAGGLS